MLIKSIKLRDHPVLGDLDLDFADQTGTPFQTIIFAGGNGCGKTILLETIHKIFEWRIQPGIGNFELFLVLDTQTIEDLTRVNFVTRSSSVDSLIIKYEKVDRGYGDWTFDFMSDGLSVVNFNYEIVSEEIGKAIFRSFLTEANVSFDAGKISSVTSLDLDNSRQLSARSGKELAQQVTQLLVDIRAGDAEELQQWVETHSSEAPPEILIGRRMKRFTDAFDYIFPTKRFRSITRVGNALEVHFEEFE